MTTACGCAIMKTVSPGNLRSGGSCLNFLRVSQIIMVSPSDHLYAAYPGAGTQNRVVRSERLILSVDDHANR